MPRSNSAGFSGTQTKSGFLLSLRKRDSLHRLPSDRQSQKPTKESSDPCGGGSRSLLTNTPATRNGLTRTQDCKTPALTSQVKSVAAGGEKVPGTSAECGSSHANTTISELPRASATSPRIARLPRISCVTPSSPLAQCIAPLISPSHPSINFLPRIIE